MPVSTATPGVFVEEVPSGTRTLTGVATSITAMVGRTRRGSVDVPLDCASWPDFERRCGGLWAESELGYAVHHFFVNGGGRVLVSRVAAGAATATHGLGGAGGLRLAAADPGSWGDRLRVSVDHGVAGSVTAVSGPDAFHLTVEEIDPAVEVLRGYEQAVVAREFFTHVSVDPLSPRYVHTVLAQQSALIRATAVPAARPAAGARLPFGGGSDGSVAQATDAAFEAAIGRLDQADLVNLMSVPPIARDRPTSAATWAAALAFCERRRAVLLVDPPDSWTRTADAADLVGGMDAFRSNNSVFTFPRVMAADPLQQNASRPFAPSGAVAGVIARTDAARGFWKAAAGTEATLRGLAGLERTLTDDDSGLLNPRGVNALRELSVVGPVVWGARTGRGADVMASEWKYLPVRRTALHIEESLVRGLRWAVFEPNDHALWGQLRASVTGFMQDLFRKGAFFGTTPSEAYLVRCDATTTTPADAAVGVVNVVVGFAPLRPAEFVILTFQQMAGQSAT
ncbi:MAG: phage tail sheath family protein [Cellulomonas sp.]|uniref:phage tail sheath family protein n=1 Tax=Cellulomonas sp. TaxID=40001 RepID=UPI0019E6B666|nr:phage tail sheath C-terminal domain-containing protein [Cellulomonas sp.]MBF0686762.1 phage tail sheath family protein [Cellulomonas sp.]